MYREIYGTYECNRKFSRISIIAIKVPLMLGVQKRLFLTQYVLKTRLESPGHVSLYKSVVVFVVMGYI